VVNWRIDASLNQGNSLKGRNNSRPSRRIQKPWGETLVTSGVEVLFPGSFDFILVVQYNPEDSFQACFIQPVISGQLNIWFKPKLGFPGSVMDVNVSTHLLA